MELTKIRIINTAQLDLAICKNGTVTIPDIQDVRNWWVDTDFIQKRNRTANQFIFKADSGNYRVTVHTNLKYLQFEPLNGDQLATTQTEGTGTVWVIGDDLGKPSVADNPINWNTDKALAMAPVGNKIYQLTLKTGVNINAHSINFKFFHQKGWGGEFTADTLKLAADGDNNCNNLFFVGDGSPTNNLNQQRDPGNLGLKQQLEKDTTYVFTLDLNNGRNNAILNVKKLTA
jgi:hypothetical protein